MLNLLLLSSLSTPSGSSLDQIYQDLVPEAELRRHSQSSIREPSLSREQQVAEPQVNRELSKQLNVALQKAGSAHKTGKSASAENLLERSEDTRAPPQHFRSRSSPIMERLNEVMLSSVAVLTAVIVVNVEARNRSFRQTRKHQPISHLHTSF